MFWQEVDIRSEYDVQLFVVFGPYHVPLTVFRQLRPEDDNEQESMDLWAAARATRWTRLHDRAAAANAKQEADEGEEQKEEEMKDGEDKEEKNDPGGGKRQRV